MRPNRLMPTLGIAGVLLVGAAIGSFAAPAIGAFAAAAAKPSPSPSASTGKAKAQAACDSFVASLAAKLKTTPANLKTQVKATIDEQIQQAVTNGKMTQAQADALKKKVDASQGCQGLQPFAGTRPRGGFGMEALTDVIGAAATALKIDPATLKTDIMSGKSLQQVAPAGMTQAQFDTAFKAALAKVLDPKVTAKTITQAQETAEIDESVKIADRLWSNPLPGPGAFAGKRGFGRPAPGANRPATAPTIQ